MMADYYLIQGLREDLISNYVQWTAWLVGISEPSVQDFLEYYKLPNKEAKKVQEIIDEILNIL